MNKKNGDLIQVILFILQSHFPDYTAEFCIW